MIISSQFFIETHVYLNHFSRDKFKNLDVDNKMSLSCGWEEPHSWPKMPFFISVISIYFVTFFFEHTVFRWFSLGCLVVNDDGRHFRRSYIRSVLKFDHSMSHHFWWNTAFRSLDKNYVYLQYERADDESLWFWIKSSVILQSDSRTSYLPIKRSKSIE